MNELIFISLKSQDDKWDGNQLCIISQTRVGKLIIRL